MANVGFTLLTGALASALFSAQAMGQVSGGSLPDPQAPFVRSSLTCSPTEPEKIVVPSAIAKRAKIKAQLLNLLRQSLYDDARGIVNIERENEIRKLASKLKNDKAD